MVAVEELASRAARLSLGVVHIAIPILLFIGLYGLWPVSAPQNKDALLPFFDTAWNPSRDHRFILIVILSGALGSYVHAATSFATYVGNSRLHRSWTWWYVLRPLIGCSLALVFYFVVRGGLLTVSGGAEDLNPFGLAAVAGMVGMFSKQATDKLRETFDTLFHAAHGKGDDERSDKLTPNPPSIDQISPASIKLGGPVPTLKITGKNFVQQSLVQVGGAQRTTRFINATSLEADLDSADVTAAGTLQVMVKNPEDSGGAGAAVSLTVA